MEFKVSILMRSYGGECGKFCLEVENMTGIFE